MFKLKLFLALSLLVHTLIFISMEWFLPSMEKPVIDAIPVRFIQEFQEDVAEELLKNDRPAKPKEIDTAYPIRTQNKRQVKSSDEETSGEESSAEKSSVDKSGQEKIPKPVQIKTVEIKPIKTKVIEIKAVEKKARKSEILAQMNAPELVVSEPSVSELVSDRKLSIEPIKPIQEAKKSDTQAIAKVVKVPLVENIDNFGKKNDIFLFMAMVRKKIEAAKFYPRSAKRRGYEGTVTVKFKILPDGAVTSLEFVKSEQPGTFDILNRAARQAVQKAAPFTRRPKSLENQDVKMKIPIAFRLK